MLLLHVAVCVAQSGISDSRAELGEVRERIRALQKDIAQTEESRSEAVDALGEAGKALASVGHDLAATQTERKRIEDEIRRLGEARAKVERSIESRRTRLAEWLTRRYMSGADAQVADFLVRRDPNQASRDGYYLQLLGRAHLSLLQAQRDDLRSMAELSTRIEAHRGKLASLEEQQQTQRKLLDDARLEYQRRVAALGSQLKEQRREVGSLRQDELRLGKLLAGLERIAREREAKRKQERERRLQEEQSAAAAARQEPRVPAAGPPTREPVVARFDRHAERTPQGVAFGKLKGQLDAPLRGEITGRFGASRVDGGPAWKGVFIRAASGSEVRAVASGEIVFADWLRGFGNLLIVDHGDGYLSIYGNNESLSAGVGQKVAGGEPIASVGSGGSSAESGLYFEIRHRGEAVDPLRWVRLR